jgi:hypothetical protein
MALALPEDGKIYACDVSDEYASVGETSTHMTFCAVFSACKCIYYLIMLGHHFSVYRQAILEGCWSGG